MISAQPSRRSRFTVLPLAVALAAAALQAPSARAATYFVDPASGNNANAGTTTATPWRTPPGTRNTANTGFASSSWGAITSSAKVACGDTLLLKGGATQSSAQGGAWLIDVTYYSSCTASNPIRIKVATAGEWPGSAGPFTLDGTGMTPTYSLTRGFGDHAALVAVADRGFVYVLGASAAQRLVVKDSSAWAINVHCMGCTNAGFRGDWWELSNGTGGGFNIGNYDNWQISNSVAHDLGLGGWQTGLNNDQLVDHGGFVDVEAYRTGPSDKMTGADDAFFFVGGKSVWCVRCSSHGNYQRGANTGVIQDAKNVEFNYRFRDLRTWDNGLACSLTAPVLYCIGAGLGVSGNDGAAPANSNNTVVRGVFFHNGDAGVWNYGYGGLEIWHGTFYRTNYKRTDTGSIGWDTTGKRLLLFNSVDMRRQGFNTFYWGNANGSLPQLNLTPLTGNNCLRPIGADTEPLGLGGAAPGGGTYAAPPAWLGSTNRIGLSACDPKFVALHDSDYTQLNLTPAAGSTLIDGGRFLLLANGAGSNATTIQVKSNGGSSDPRQFFIDPSSFLEPADTDRQVQIEGCGVRAIVGMTASSITFTPACTWADGAGIHLPWSGSRPDVGAIETTGSPPPPPVLLSIEPVP